MKGKIRRVLGMERRVGGGKILILGRVDCCN